MDEGRSRVMNGLKEPVRPRQNVSRYESNFEQPKNARLPEDWDGVWFMKSK